MHLAGNLCQVKNAILIGFGINICRSWVRCWQPPGRLFSGRSGDEVHPIPWLGRVNTFLGCLRMLTHCPCCCQGMIAVILLTQQWQWSSLTSLRIHPSLTMDCECNCDCAITSLSLTMYVSSLLMKMLGDTMYVSTLLMEMLGDLGLGPCLRVVNVCMIGWAFIGKIPTFSHPKL